MAVDETVGAALWVLVRALEVLQESAGGAGLGDFGEVGKEPEEGRLHGLVPL